MKTPSIEREYQYRDQAGRLYIRPLFAAALSLFAVYQAVVGTGIHIRGFPFHINGIAARLLWMGCGLSVASVGYIWSRRLWERLSSPNQRIAFTPTGVLVPVPGSAEEETHVKYGDIHALGIELERDRLPSRIEKLICIDLITPAGIHSIYGRELREGECDEVIVRIINNVDDQVGAAIDPVLWFDLATKLESAGDWHQAFRYYSIAANRLQGTQDGEYAINCVQRLKEKIDMAATESPSGDAAT